MMAIRHNKGMIPGGVQYQDPRTPAAVWSDSHTFPDERVQQVIAFRKANPGIYPEPEWTDFNFVRQQVVEYNCARLGGNGEYCFDTEPVLPMPSAGLAKKVCPDCGANMTPQFCPTCAGQKITGYRCPQCGREMGR